MLHTDNDLLHTHIVLLTCMVYYLYGSILKNTVNTVLLKSSGK